MAGQIELVFPDGNKKKHEKGITAKEVIEKDIGTGLLRAALAAKVNDTKIDLSTPITESGTFKVLTFKDKEGIEIFRHSTSHVLAQAVLRLFPDAKPTIGPAVEDGFYYDFDIDKTFTPEDLEKIQEEMQKIVKENLSFSRKEMPKQEAKKLFADNPYKVELIDSAESDTGKAVKEESKVEGKSSGMVTIYTLGEGEGSFADLCRGPHIPSTGMIKSLKLTRAAGAYWRGDANNKQLQRIYGISFDEKKKLENFLKMLEEAEKRDHRKIGKELDLIFFHEYAPGAPFFLKKGTVIYNILIDFIRQEYKKRGYQEVITPQLYNKKLWETSGHWEHYKNDMFIVNIEGQEHSLKPMNCPSHCLIYNRDAKSYKDLPIRIADFCCLHRNELSGTLSGLFRVRKFAQDDGHIFCRLDQIEEEVIGVLEFIKYVWEEVFGFKLTYYLSTRPEKCLGTKEIWDKAEALLSAALDKAGIPYEIKAGEGAFYGPKIDIDIQDCLGRKWQCPTCQLDFNLPHRFENMYVDEKGEKQECVMIHRAVLGSLERFFGIMTEHYAGKFPLWLSPVQVKILTVADRFNSYAHEVKQMMADNGIRVEVDDRSESIPKKVRDAQLEQINYILVVGEKEISEKTVTIRTRDNKIHGAEKVDTFINKLLEEIKAKK